METMIQPKVTGYRQLSKAEADLMNESKALAEKVGEFVAKLRALPPTPASGVPFVNHCADGDRPSIDQRWVSLGASQLQQGFMALVRGIAQPSTF